MRLHVGHSAPRFLLAGSLCEFRNGHSISGTPFASEEGPCLSWLISPEGSTQQVIWNLSDSSATELPLALGHVMMLVSLGHV